MSPPRGLWWTLGAFPASGHPSLPPNPGPSLCRSGCPMQGPYQFSHRLHTPAPEGAPTPSPTSAVQASSPQSLVLFWSQVHAPGGIGCLLGAGQDPAAQRASHRTPGRSLEGPQRTRTPGTRGCVEAAVCERTESRALGGSLELGPVLLCTSHSPSFLRPVPEVRDSSFQL